MKIRFGLLLIALLLSASAAVRVFAKPSPWEAEYRKARALVHRIDAGPVAALAFLEEALKRAGNSNDDWVVGMRSYRGELLAMTGKTAEGLQILDRPLPRHLQTSELEFRRRSGRALVLYHSNRKNEGDAIVADLVPFAQKHLPALVAEAYYARGNLLLREEDIREAMRLAKKADNGVLALLSETVLVRIYERRERYGEAVEVAERVLPQLERAKLTTFSTISGNLGSTFFQLGDYDTSKEYFLRAEGLSRKLGVKAQQVIWLDRIGDVHLAMNDLAGAAKWYADAENAARGYGEHRQLGRALQNRAKVAIRLGQYGPAAGWLDEAIALEKKGKDDGDVRRALIIRASLYRARGRYDDAEKELKAVLPKPGEGFNVLDRETELARVYAAKKNLPLADQYFTRALKTALEARKTIEDKYRISFFNSVEELFDAYVDFLVANGQIEKALEITEESRARTLADVLPKVAKKVPPSDVAARSNATILAYWLGRTNSYVWTIAPGGVSLQRLRGAAEIGREVAAYRRDLEGSFANCSARGQRLYQMLVAPALRSAAKDARVIVIADGTLHSLNFETLIVPGARPHWWIDDVIVSNASSLRLLARKTKAKPSAPKMLLVGNPVQADAAFPALPKANVEMQKVGQHFAHTKLEGARATPDAFLAASPGKFDFIHFVAHGTARGNRPLDSAVILAKAPRGDRYKLYAHDIIRQPLSARLVTISSCHGAGTRAYAGEGLVGLAWAFLRAGADQVVAALWEVDDNATPVLMDRMYKAIREGRDPAVALRDAKRSFIHAQAAQQRPRFWAPFVLYSGS
jgi:CHAT domain-containing protein